MPAAREMILKKESSGMSACRSFAPLLPDLDCGDLLPVCNGFGEGVIIDRNDHRAGRQDRK
ncbi:MAG: hypothetical protein HY895_03290 [Deltaproteobacteria bacterium]|nr:hypothetical protein [Deltaproteobacteria bacterium]